MEDQRLLLRCPYWDFKRFNLALGSLVLSLLSLIFFFILLANWSKGSEDYYIVRDTQEYISLAQTGKYALILGCLAASSLVFLILSWRYLKRGKNELQFVQTPLGHKELSFKLAGQAMRLHPPFKSALYTIELPWRVVLKQRTVFLLLYDRFDRVLVVWREALSALHRPPACAARLDKETTELLKGVPEYQVYRTEYKPFLEQLYVQLQDGELRPGEGAS